MASTRLILICLFGVAFATLVESVGERELDTLLVNLFYDPQRQVNDDETIYGHLERAVSLFDTGVKLEYEDLAKYEDRVRRLVQYCRPNAEIKECETVEGFEPYDKIGKIRANAIGNFLRNCFTNKLEQCAPTVASKIEQGLGGLDQSVKSAIQFILGPVDTTNKSTIAEAIAFVMLDASGEAVTNALSKENGREIYERLFNRVFEGFCRPLTQKLDARARFYGTAPFDEPILNFIVTWNSIAEHCKFILDNKEDIVNDSYNYLSPKPKPEAKCGGLKCFKG